jgi:hypothetical protein
VYKQIKPVSELAVSKLSTILNDSFENCHLFHNTQVNVTDVLLELSKVLMLSEIWSKLVRFLSKIYPLQHSHSILDSPGWLEITIPCIHEVN